ncbi:MAG: hypothetical protein V1914_05045 [archaeon]
MAKTQKKTLVKKKKKWYTILAPKEMNQVIIGETPASDISLLQGRVVKANLMNLTNDMKKQSMVASFKVKSVKESTAETEFTGYVIMPSHVKRLVKRSKDKVGDSFKCETKDGKKIVIKPLLLIKNKLQRNVLSSLRMTARDVLTKEAKNKTFSELASAIFNKDIQKTTKQALKKVYPVTMVEIRALELA